MHYNNIKCKLILDTKLYLKEITKYINKQWDDDGQIEATKLAVSTIYSLSYILASPSRYPRQITARWRQDPTVIGKPRYY